MSQHDYSIANQGFPATRTDINNVLSAIATNNSGTSAPSTQYAGQFWIDTTSSTWTLYIHDGADDIQFATIDTSANTVNFIDSELGDNSVTTAKIADGNVTSAKLSYPLTTFSSTGIDDNATSTAITIDSSENVGIGTSSPANALHINSSGASPLRIERDSGTDSNCSIEFNCSTNDYYVGVNPSNNFAIGTSVDQSGANFQIDSSGRVLVGRTVVGSSGNDDGIVLYPAGEIISAKVGTSLSTHIFFVNNTGVSATTVGTIQSSGSSTSYNTSSDYRLKENVSYDFDATTRLKQLKPARFNFIADANTTVDGFLAHEVSDIVPEAISGEKDAVQVWKEGEELPEGVSVGDNKLDENGNAIPEYQGIDQSKLVPLLVKTIQELEARITTLENA